MKRINKILTLKIHNYKECHQLNLKAKITDLLLKGIELRLL